jgi:hypothetical protein
VEADLRIKDMLHGAVIAAIVAAGIFWLSGCDEECPICPGPEPVSDYDIYVGGWLPGNPIFVYNTRLQAITDSMIVADSAELWDLEVSGDGKYLLLATYDWYRAKHCMLTIYDLATMDTVKNHVGGNKLEVSNTGKYIAVFGYKVDSIAFLDGVTFEPYFTEKRAFMNGRFSTDDSKFYCVSRTNEIFIYDMAAKALDTVLYYYDNDGYFMAITAVQPSLDGTRLYLLASYNSVFHCIMSYLPEYDSSVLQYWIGPPGGDIRLTPDGKYVIVTDPGYMDMDEIGSENIIFIDTKTDAVVALISGPFGLCGGQFSGILPGELAILPDSRFTMVATKSYEAFGMIDNRLHQFVDIENGPAERAVCRLVACQKALK